MQNPVARLALTSLFAFGLISPAMAQAPEGLQVVRADDQAMGCEALIAEHNGLNETLAQAEANRAKREAGKKMGRTILGGLARGALTGAANIGYRSNDPITASALSHAAHAAADVAGDAIARSGDAQPTDGPTFEEQRIERLEVLLRQKGC